MSVRASFVEHFGEAQAYAIESAADGHDNVVHSNRGSDPFKWAITIAIGSECLTRYAGDHGITADHAAVREWIRTEGDLGSHDGDVDYLALFAGAYDEYLPVTE